jgi:hypothetical protein
MFGRQQQQQQQASKQANKQDHRKESEHDLGCERQMFAGDWRGK